MDGLGLRRERACVLPPVWLQVVETVRKLRREADHSAHPPPLVSAPGPGLLCASRALGLAALLHMPREERPPGRGRAGCAGAWGPPGGSGSPSPLRSCELRVSPSGALTGLLGTRLCAAAPVPRPGDSGALRARGSSQGPGAVAEPLATSLQALELVWWEAGLDVGEYKLV